MGAVRFSIDADLVRLLTSELPLEVFVETGTFEGAAVGAVFPFFAEIHTIELSEELASAAEERFGGAEQVRVHHGRSEDVLGELSPSLKGRPALFWLDAHWSDEPGAEGAEGQCPLLEELDAIASLDESSVVMIDDARLFLAPPPRPADAEQWPELSQVLERLAALNPEHELMVIDDVIVYFPPTAKESLRDYALEHAVDWLAALDVSRATDAQFGRLESEIEATASRLERRIGSLGSQVEDVQRGLQSLNAESRASREVIDHVAGHGAKLDATRIAVDHQREEIEAMRREISPLLAAEGARLRRRAAVGRVLGAPFRLLAALTARPRRRLRAARQDWGVRLRRLRLQPKLGLLQHHPPTPLSVPKRYHGETPPDEPPTISIVTPSYNQGAYLESTLESVLEQEYPRLEYIVQDGGSSDESRAVLERYGDRLHRWETGPDAGQAHAINLGMAHAHGEIMAYLNSDDLLLPGSLCYVARYFDQHPDVDVVYGHRVLIDEAGREIGRWVLPRHEDAILSWADYVPQESLFWRRRIWDAAGGGVDEDFRFALDWDLILRFRDAGARIVRVPRFLGAFRVHTAQKSSAEAETAGATEMARIRTREHEREISDEEIGREIRWYLRRHVFLHKLYRAGAIRY